MSGDPHGLTGGAVLGVEKRKQRTENPTPGPRGLRRRRGTHPHRPPLLLTVTRIPCDIPQPTVTRGNESVPSDKFNSEWNTGWRECKCRVASVCTAATRSEISARVISMSGSYDAGGSPRSRHFGFGIAAPHKTLNHGSSQQNAVNGGYTALVPIHQGKERKKKGSAEVWTCVPADRTEKRVVVNGQTIEGGHGNVRSGATHLYRPTPRNPGKQNRKWESTGN